MILFKIKPHEYNKLCIQAAFYSFTMSDKVVLVYCMKLAYKVDIGFPGLHCTFLNNF